MKIKKQNSNKTGSSRILKHTKKKSAKGKINRFDYFKDLFSFLKSKEIWLFKNKNHKILSFEIWFCVLLLFSIICFSIFWVFTNSKKLDFVFNIPDFFKNASAETVLNCNNKRILDGECLKENENKYSPIFAVIIENHPDARPISGLQEASIVYEALVEGPITRFLAIYPYNVLVKKIGPVRSARPYFVDFANEYKGLYSHVGGSPQALNLIQNSELKNFDEYSKSEYYWRDNLRIAPHNVYTSSELLQNGYKNYFGDEFYEYTPWRFKDSNDFETRGEDGSIINVLYSTPLYDSIWKYNKEENNYKRYLGEKPYLQEDKKEIFANTIIVIEAEMKVTDDIGRKTFNLEKGGFAKAYRDGKEFEIKWEKTKNNRIVFLKSNNNEFFLNRGKVWVHLVSSLKSVTNNATNL